MRCVTAAASPWALQGKGHEAWRLQCEPVPNFIPKKIVEFCDSHLRCCCCLLLLLSLLPSR